MSALLVCVLEGGPGCGVPFTAPQEVDCVLVTMGREVHGYVFAGRSSPSGWVYRWRGVTGWATGGKSAAEVLAGRPHIPLSVKQVKLSELGEGGAA